MLALQRGSTPPQKIKSLFGTVLTTHHIDIVSLPISTGSSSSHLYSIRGKTPQDKHFSPVLLSPPRTHVEKLKVKKPLYHSFYIIIINIIIMTIIIVIQI